MGVPDPPASENTIVLPCVIHGPEALAPGYLSSISFIYIAQCVCAHTHTHVHTCVHMDVYGEYAGARARMTSSVFLTLNHFPRQSL